MKDVSLSALPKAREHRLIVKELPDETLVYDLDADLAYCLNTTAQAVWKRCDGSQSVKEIGDAIGKETGTQVDESIVWLALDQLEKSKLLDQTANGFFAGGARRRVIRNIGVTALALPIIVSIVVPDAYAQGSCVNPGGAAPGGRCGANNQCCSDRCCGSPGNPSPPCSPNNTCL